MKNKDILYGIKAVGNRFYISTDEKTEKYTLVTEFKDALLFKEEVFAKTICSSLNKRNGMKSCQFETYKVLNPFIEKGGKNV